MTAWKFAAALFALANVGYFLWSHGPGGGQPGAAVEQPSAATLTLASEAPASATSPPPSAAPASIAAAPTAPPSADAAASPAASPAVSTAAPTAPPPAAAGAPPAAASAATQGAGPELLGNVKRCVSVGPFRDVAEAAHAASTLRTGGYDPRQRVAEGEVWVGLWVYVPAPANRAAAEQMLAKLKRGGIDDVMEMPGPGDAPVYSLGLFSEPKRAQARVAQAQAVGFNPLIADRKRSGNVYWIDVDLKPTDNLADLSDLSDMRGESGRILRLTVSGCPVAGASP